MVMQVLRHALTKESDYTFANCFLYNQIGQNWDGSVDPRNYIKPSIKFLAGCLDSVKRAMVPVTTRARMLELIDENFPTMLTYIRQESRNQGLGGGPIDINESTQIDLQFFTGSLNFYKVSCLSIL